MRYKSPALTNGGHDAFAVFHGSWNRADRTGHKVVRVPIENGVPTTAPDGSILVADWNDAGVGGHQMADQKIETMTGRIYRVAPKGHKVTASSLDLSSAAGAASAAG